MDSLEQGGMALDAFLAEHAFGWMWWVNTPKPEVTPTPSWAITGVRFLREPGYSNASGLQAPAKGDEPIGAGQYDHEYPHYSTDTVASKALRDRMRELGWSYRVSGCGTEGVSFGCRMSRNAECWFRSSESEELAIAQAAYKALGGVDA